MGRCQTLITQFRVYIEDELTHAYIAIEAIGDCPIGVQGWHYRAFGKNKSTIDILNEWVGSGDYLSAPQKAPPERGETH